MAANASCMVKPIATPISTCCSASQTACGEKIATLTGGRLGAITTVISIPSPILTRLGIDFSLSTGAVMISAITRSSGQK
ncbi:hypothetical protein D3C81_2109100 [compost metagenome]